MSLTPSTFALQPGSPAPDFTLPDAAGSDHQLQHLTGKAGTLIIFACNHCPYVIHLAEALSHFAREMDGVGIKTIAITSNDVEKYPADSPAKMQIFSRKNAWNFPYLYDEDQSVAKAFSAACTPDFFLFDSGLKLHYAGQFDASRPGSEQPVTGADLRAAAESLLAKQPAATPFLPATGCNIKWKPGNEPSYF